MRDEQRTTNKQTLKIELLSQWKLEAEFRNIYFGSEAPTHLNMARCFTIYQTYKGLQKHLCFVRTWVSHKFLHLF